MVITGIAAGFVADLIKKKMIVSWSNIKEKNEVIDLFGQQISPQIAENILKNQKQLSGVRKKVCIMFLDLRGFTPFVEQHQPEEVVDYLNTLFGFMIKIIESHNGVINQFLGDGFMATFGAPVSIENSSQHATLAAEEIIEKVNSEYDKGNIPKTRIGIGLHYDEAVTGNIGSITRKQYSITGKVVIIASRIEQLNKKYNTNLIISDDVFNHLNKGFQHKFVELGTTKIKGSEKPISLHKFVKANTKLLKKEDNEN
jgi:adenylate cyclase